MSEDAPAKNTVAPDVTGQKQDTRFKPGISGNPAGRKRGSRSKLGTAFLDALYDDFESNGTNAIRMARTQNPLGYVKLVADVLPKEIVHAAFSIHANIDLSEEFERAATFADAYRVLEQARDRLGAKPMIDLNPEAEMAWRSDSDD
jgi:hypothetical protein